MPELSDAAWANRGFHQRAARWIAERGVRQFIDIGSGLPTTGNTHEVVQQVRPDARVVYVDNDPMVAAHARQLLAEDGSTKFILADLRDPDGVLGNPGIRAHIDFGEPAGLLMTSVVHFVADDLDPWALVARYMAAVAPGSYLALSRATMDKLPPRMVEADLEMYARCREALPAHKGRGRAVLRRPRARSAVSGRRGCRQLCRNVGRRRSRDSPQRRITSALLRGRQAPLTHAPSRRARQPQ